MKEKPIKKIIIIGGGLSGLSSGIFAQKNGYISEIFERNATPGGLCTCWYRKGYKLDGCIHWLTGTKEGTELNRVWKALDAFDQEDIIRDTSFSTIEVDGTPIILWNDLNKLEEELVALAPLDKKLIKKYIRYAKLIFKVPLPLENSMSDMSMFGAIKRIFLLIPYLPVIVKCLTTSNVKFAKKFKSPLLQKFFATILPGDKHNLYQVLYAYGTCANGSGGVPIGGSLAMSQRLARNYEHLGGLIHYRTDVEEIIVEGKKAVGIRLKNGECHYADYVVSSTDINHTLNHLLKGEYKSNRFGSRFRQTKKYYAPSCLLASYSVDVKKFETLGISNTYEFPIERIKIGNHTEKTLRIRSYSYDKTFIKNGRVLLNVLCHQDDEDYPFWQELNKDKAAYNAHKEEIGNLIKQRIENRFRLLKDDLELLDVVTPETFVRYTNAHHGAYMSWAITSKNSMLLHDGKVRGIKNLILSGQWLQMPGGIPIAICTGKYSIDRINNKELKFPIVKFFRTAKLK